MRPINALLAPAVAATMLLSPATAAASPAPSGTTGPWEPPPGYTFERSYFGGNAPCNQAGDRGLADGRWNAYLCHEVLRKAADLWFLYGDLYVRTSAGRSGGAEVVGAARFQARPLGGGTAVGAEEAAVDRAFAGPAGG